MAGGGVAVPVRRDLETEELIEDQQVKIRELERQVARLKEKFLVAKQQMLAVKAGQFDAGGGLGS